MRSLFLVTNCGVFYCVMTIETYWPVYIYIGTPAADLKFKYAVKERLNIVVLF